jgi:hypothetical protein
MVQIEPTPAQTAINQMQAWQIRVSSSDGTPVRNARIAVDGGMPQHGHGLPTRPQVTREVADGTYLMEGMKFMRDGLVRNQARHPGGRGSDTALFNAVVDASGVKR